MCKCWELLSAHFLIYYFLHFCCVDMSCCTVLLRCDDDHCYYFVCLWALCVFRSNFRFYWLEMGKNHKTRNEQNIRCALSLYSPERLTVGSRDSIQNSTVAQIVDKLQLWRIWYILHSTTYIIQNLQCTHMPVPCNLQCENFTMRFLPFIKFIKFCAHCTFSVQMGKQEISGLWEIE